MADKIRVFVCTEGKKCPKRGSADVCKAFDQAVSDLGVDKTVSVRGTKCLKLCKGGPSVVVMPSKAKYGRVEPGEASEIIAHHVKSDEPIDKLLYDRRKKEKKSKKKEKKSSKEKKDKKKK